MPLPSRSINFQVVEYARETIVPAATCREDVLRRDAYRQPPRVRDLTPIRVQVAQEDQIAAKSQHQVSRELG